MSVVNVEGLDEASPEEIEAEEAAIEPKQIDNQNSPFAHMLNNLIAGGGRQGETCDLFLLWKPSSITAWLRIFPT